MAEGEWSIQPGFRRRRSGPLAQRYAAFVLERLEEPHADEEVAKRRPYVADTRIVPLFLIIRCQELLGRRHQHTLGDECG